MQNRTQITVVVVTLVAASLASARTHGNANVNSIREHDAKVMLENIRSYANDARDEADFLRLSIARASVTRGTEYSHLEALKEDINHMGKEMAVLNSERDSLPAWERNAVDRILPLLQKAALDTTKATEYFNAHQLWLPAPQSASYADNIYNETGHIVNTLRHSLAMEKILEQENKVATAMASDSD